MNTPSQSADAVRCVTALGAGAVGAQITEEWCMLHRLIEDLTDIQHRLGTPLERPDDLVQIRELGHEIRNKLFRLQILANSGATDLDLPAA